jgi:hypothetical protein
VYPGEYPGSLISLILIGKISVAEADEQDAHTAILKVLLSHLREE